MRELEEILKRMRGLMYLSLGVGTLLTVALLIKFQVIQLNIAPSLSEPALTESQVVDTSLYGTIDEQSGLIIDVGLDVVKAQCGACHSTALVAQNRLTREGWKDLIRWMQAEQNLWDLGPQEVVVLDYLEKNCSPQESGRRKNLTNIEWYVLTE